MDLPQEMKDEDQVSDFSFGEFLILLKKVGK